MIRFLAIPAQLMEEWQVITERRLRIMKRSEIESITGESLEDMGLLETAEDMGIEDDGGIDYEKERAIKELNLLY
jgi:hypothetical protein